MKSASPASDPEILPEPQPKTGFWQKRLIQPIRNQLTQGVSPEALSWALAAGLLLAIFPIMGTTTLLCTLAGFAFRLNQPVIQTVNWLAYPLQLLLIPFFIRLGETITGAEPIAFSIPKMLELFGESPARFFGEFGATCLHAIGAWIVVAPLSLLAVILITRPLLRSAARKWAPQKVAEQPS